MLQQTPLESALLNRFHELYHANGFPAAKVVRVIRRENTGGGRYVDIASDERVHLDDGYIDLEGKFIEMNGIPNGMMAVAVIKDGRLTTLEFTVYGGDYWDGVERGWKFV